MAAEGESGTPREGSSADSCPEAIEASGGTQSAPPSFLEARPRAAGEALAEAALPAAAAVAAGARLAAFTVLSRLLHDGVDYPPGATVLLAAAAAAPLLAAGALEPAG